MPTTSYINIRINNETVDVSEIADLPIAISYALEDSEDFQKKKGTDAINIDLPASLRNQKVANSYHDPSSEDLTPGQTHKSHQPAIIEANGVELLVGKAFLQNAVSGRIPKSYQYNFYGGNGDWIVDMKEKTLYDFLAKLTYINSIDKIVLSWNYDGRDEAMPYVYAPVKYRGYLDPEAGNDNNVSPSALRPAISKYFILYWAFKSLGYRIQSDFFDLDYFRRQTMPWTWGSFLSSEGTKLDIHKFLAKSTIDRFVNSDFYGFLDVNMTDINQPGVFDNNNEFTYVASPDPYAEWEYKAPNNGTLTAFFFLTVSTNGNIVGENSFYGYWAEWYKIPAGTNTLSEPQIQVIDQRSGANIPIGGADRFDTRNDTLTARFDVNPGDKIRLYFRLRVHEGWGIGARVNFHTTIDELKVEFGIPSNGTISFENYTGFKKFKILDYIAGIVDEFNLSMFTDTVNKVLYVEPTHDYNVDGTVRKGFFNGDYVDWEGKKDLSKDAKMNLFSDYERELLFRYKDDGNDGLLKVLQDRNQNTLASGKYLFPKRFKDEKREHENRFFAPAVHYEPEQFKSITGISPQMVAIIPENISNTSNSEADNTFTPKSLYYAGLVTGQGGWKFGGENHTQYPLMFAVNYKAGGELYPVLSYSDENINGVVAKGLMKQFFTQRMAIMRNGQYYDVPMYLKDVDVNRLHREHKAFDGQKWELVQISNYLPLKSESTECSLRKWTPITKEDYDNSFPSEQSVLHSDLTLKANDVKYAPLIALQSDIPK